MIVLYIVHCVAEIMGTQMSVALGNMQKPHLKKKWEFKKSARPGSLGLSNQLLKWLKHEDQKFKAPCTTG